MAMLGLKLEPDVSPYNSGTMDSCAELVDVDKSTRVSSSNWLADYSYGIDLGSAMDVTKLRIWSSRGFGQTDWKGPLYNNIAVYKSDDGSSWALVQAFNGPTLGNTSDHLYTDLEFSTSQNARYFKAVNNGNYTLALGDSTPFVPSEMQYYTASATSAPATTLIPTTLAPTTLATSVAPTTLATTAAPTTLATTAAPTTMLTTLAPTTLPPEIVIDCDPIEVTLYGRATGSLYPPAARDATKDMTFYCDPIEVTLAVEGETFNVVIYDCLIETTASVVGAEVFGVIIDCDPIEAVVSLYSYGFFLENKRCNWVKWSKIGRLDFTIDESNLAGERPLDWKGCVYRVEKLGDQVIAYGENGISVLKPAGVNWGLKTVHRRGLISRYSMAGNDEAHFFIDKTNKLFMVTAEGAKELGYDEFLEGMTNPVLTLDERLGLLYICDDTYGYVYNPSVQSFGSGPVGITGVGFQDGTPYFVSSDTLKMPKFLLTTDIYDFETRKPKTLDGVEVGTDLIDKVQAMIETRVSNKGEFRQTDWVSVNRNGIAYIPCYGVEFKINLRLFNTEVIDIDYLKVFGVVHGFSYLELQL